MQHPNTIHGQSRTRMYRIWKGMKTRCYNPNVDSYKNYGAKGISLCAEWKDDFAAFYKWSMANGYNDTLTIDRIRTSDNYCPENCRWLSAFDNNSLGHTRFIELFGEVKSLREWLNDKRCNVGEASFHSRIGRGMTVEEALTVPPARPLVMITAFGETKTQSEWANDKRCIVPYNLLRKRIHYGWSAEEAITHPRLHQTHK